MTVASVAATETCVLDSTIDCEETAFDGEVVEVCWLDSVVNSGTDAVDGEASDDSKMSF